MRKLKYLAALLIGIAGLALQPANAELGMSYTTDSQYLLGTVIPPDGTGSGQTAEAVNMTNVLLGMSNAMNNQMSLNGSLYSRTTLAGHGTAVIPGAMQDGGVGGTGPISVTFTGTFHYLVATYDGVNAGVPVWDITGLTGTILLYRYAKVELDGMGNPTGNLLGSNIALQDYHQISSWTLLNPYVAAVPDGGTTVMLLGAALGALGMARRYLKR